MKVSSKTRSTRNESSNFRCLQSVEVEVDEETGDVRILRMVNALDVGKVLNPKLLAGQIYGGIAQGIGYALYEEVKSEKGRILNPGFLDYKIPTAMDAPDNIVPIIVEVPQPDGPYGARGVGEHTMIPAAPLIANAVEDAVGVRIKSMPVTKEKVALEFKKTGRK